MKFCWEVQAEAILDQIHEAFSHNNRLGLVFPDDPNIVDWTINREVPEKMARRMGYDILPQHFNFPVGSMFWARKIVLNSFIDLDLGWSDYPTEPLTYEGTMLHAIERLFGILPALEGWSCAVTNTHGVTRK